MFACYDIRSGGEDWDRKTVISDDELRVLFERVPRGVLLEVLLDTCHSGTGLKDLLPGQKARFLPPPTRRGMQRLAAKSDPKGYQELVKTTPAATRAVLFAGCKADQTSADAYFDGRYSGAFTYYFLKALAQDGARLPQAAGVLTPATAIGMPLVERLREHRFTFETERLPG